MGSCYSANESHKIKTTTYNRQKKTTGCLGSTCCESGKNLNNQNRQVNAQANIPNIQSSYTINYKKGQINDYIDNLISEKQSPIPLQKITFVQLYNIFMNFAYDFTTSEFIICDTREENKSQSFLKKFSQINYKPRQVESMSEDRMKLFKNYIRNKNIIFILNDEKNFEVFEQFITIFSINYDLNLKNIYILIEPIQKADENQINKSYLEHLYSFLDEDALYKYTPKILINSIDIKSGNLNYENIGAHNALAFVSKYPHKVNTDAKNIHLNQLDINNICNQELEEENIYLNFFAKFNIENILNFISLEKFQNENNSNSGLITHCKERRNKIKGEEKRTLIRQKNISIPKNINEFSEYYNLIQTDFDNIIKEFQGEIIDNKSIIIEFDDDIDDKIKMKMLFIIIYKITRLSFEDIENYLRNNFFILKNEENIWPAKNEIEYFFN